MSYARNLDQEKLANLVSENQDELSRWNREESPFSDYDILKIGQEDCIRIRRTDTGVNNLAYIDEDNENIGTVFHTYSTQKAEGELEEGWLEDTVEDFKGGMSKQQGGMSKQQERIIEAQTENGSEIDKIIMLGKVQLWAEKLTDEFRAMAWFDCGIIPKVKG